MNPEGRIIHFVANCVYGDHVAGGDIHFFNMARAAREEGWTVRFFGGQALRDHLRSRGLDASVTLTDQKKMRPVNPERLGGQLRLLLNYAGRFVRTLRQLSKIQRGDAAYAVTDYWFDTLPVILCRAGRKMMVLGMDAPTFMQVLLRARPDVPPNRITSLYYWASQNLSLRLFRFCRRKKLLYVHPLMKPRLLRIGYREDELVFVSNGFDRESVESTVPQPKRYDVVWTGRPHRQKGIDDLIATLRFLSGQFPDLTVALVGRLDALRARVELAGLSSNVHFSGYVSEREKFQILRESRVFLMPSNYESWGIVIAEALTSGVSIVAYDLPVYRPIFGELMRYVPCFDLRAFQRAAAEAVRATRAAPAAIKEAELREFIENSSWEAARQRFRAALADLAG